MYFVTIFNNLYKCIYVEERICINNSMKQLLAYKLRVGQIDCYGEEVKSQATGDLGEIPLALQKMTSKIERSGICLSVGHGSGQAARSLVVQ